VGAYVHGKLVGLAGCSADCDYMSEELWEDFGIDGI